MTQTAILTTTDGGGGLGNSVAISGDTIVVRAPYASVGSNQVQGKVYVYVKPAGGWRNMTQTAELTASDQSGELGYFVSISGNTVLAGAPYTLVGSNPNQGAAYVFVKPAAGWKNMTENAELTASDGTSYNILGWYASVSGDTAVVGAPNATLGTNYSQGEAYVFVKPASGWVDMTQTATLTASDGQAGDGLGVSVGVSGNTVVAGAYYATIGSNSEQGAAYVFVKPASGWANATQTAKLVASDGAAINKLGWSLFISGHTVVVAAPGFNNYQGAAYLFTEPAHGWKNTSIFGAKLTASGGQQGDRLGWCVAIGGDAVVGGTPQVNFGSNTKQGATYAFAP